jgi:AcrR family transcriptional regulator
MGRTHGWAGDPPGSDEEAIRRILAATRACIDRDGPRVSMTDVAEELGVTRQTVYRYFAGTEALLRATSFEAAGGFLDRLARHVGRFDDPVDAVIEGMVFTVERLPKEPHMGLLLKSGRVGAFVRGVSSETAMTIGRAMLGPFADDWRGRGVSDETIDELVEWTLRVLQSLLVDPGRPPRRGVALRRYLARWLAPALHAQLDMHAGHPT